MWLKTFSFVPGCLIVGSDVSHGAVGHGENGMGWIDGAIEHGQNGLIGITTILPGEWVLLLPLAKNLGIVAVISSAHNFGIVLTKVDLGWSLRLFVFEVDSLANKGQCGEKSKLHYFITFLKELLLLKDNIL